MRGPTFGGHDGGGTENGVVGRWVYIDMSVIIYVFSNLYQTLSKCTPTFTRSENQHSHITPPAALLLLGVTSSSSLGPPWRDSPGAVFDDERGRR